MYVYSTAMAVYSAKTQLQWYSGTVDWREKEHIQWLELDLELDHFWLSRQLAPGSNRSGRGWVASIIAPAYRGKLEYT